MDKDEKQDGGGGKVPRVEQGSTLYLYVRTGTQFGAGTDSKITARIYFIDGLISFTESLIYQDGANVRIIEVELDNKLYDDFERGELDYFRIDKIPPNSTILAITVKNTPFGIDPDWFLEDIVAVFQNGNDVLELIDAQKVETFGEQLEFQKLSNENLVVKSNGNNNRYSFFHLHQWVLTNQERTLFNESISLNMLKMIPETQRTLKQELEIKQKECIWAYDGGNIEVNRGILNQIRQRITRLSLKPADTEFYRGKVPNYPLYPPLSEDFDDPKFGWFLKSFISPQIRAAFHRWDSPKDAFVALFSHYIEKSELAQERDILLRRYEYVADHSDDDEEFGRQIIQGVTCNQIFRYTHASRSTQDIFAGIVGRDNQGSYFILDYLEDLKGIPLNHDDGKNWYCAPAAVLLKSDKSSEALKPIAIFLQSDGQPGVMFTPNDVKTWRVAKAFARCAMFSVHQMIYHAFRTHFASEVYFTALYRQLPTTHPLYVLLYPHMRYVAGINDKARTTLVSKGGRFDDISAITGSTNGHLRLFEKELKRYDCFKVSNLPQDLETRGFGDSEEELPNYYFAHDARALYNIFFDYSKSILDVAYGTDAIINDQYVNAFLDDVRHGFAVDGTPGKDGLRPTVDRSKIKTGDLAELVAQVIFMSSAQHAAVNFGQLMQYGNVENGPAHLRLPPPTSADQNIPDIKEYLPDKERQVSQMTTGYTLSSRNLERDRSLLINPDPETVNFFNPLTQHNPNYAPICWITQDKLIKLQTEIVQRNNNLNHQNKIEHIYDWLLPSKVPISIAI